MKVAQTIVKSILTLGNFEFRGPSCVFMLAFLTLLPGCSYFFGGQPKPAPITFTQSTETCLRDFKVNVVSWAKSGKPRMGPQIDCVVRGIDLFAAQTTGRSGDGWSKEELARFFDKYFPSTSGPSSQWIDELLKIKQTWFGGYVDRLKRGELNQLRAFLLLVKPDLDALSPDVPVLFFRDVKQNQLAQNSSERVWEHLNSLSNLIADEVRKTKATRPAYDVDSALEFAFKLGIIPAKTPRLVKISEAVKGLLVGGSSRFIISNEWPSFLRSLAKTWGLAARIKYQVVESQDPFGKDEKSLEKIVDDGTNLLARLAQPSADRPAGIPRERFTQLIDAFASRDDVAEDVAFETIAMRSTTNLHLEKAEKGESESHLLPFGLRASTVNNLLPILFGKILYGNSKADSRAKAEVLGPEQVKALRAALENWLAGFRVIDSLYSKATDPHAGISVWILAKDLAVVPGSVADDVEDSKLTDRERAEKKARSEFLDLLTAGRPLIRDDQRRLLIEPSHELPDMPRENLYLMNHLRAGISTLLRGYTYDPRPTRDLWPTVTRDEVDEIYQDIRAFGIDLNLVDVRTFAAGRRTFLEANIFTSVSKGGDRIGTHELTEWFYSAVGASHAGDVVYKKLLAAGCGMSGLRDDVYDVFGNRKLELGCFRERFWSEFAANFVNLPHLVQWYESANDKDKESFKRALEEAGRTVGADHFGDPDLSGAYPIDSSDFRAIFPILHYTESLMTNFDINPPFGVLDSTELDLAYPRFNNLMNDLAPGQSDSIKRTLFSYLVTFGEPPSSSWKGKAGVLAWSLVHPIWRESADRLRILQVIGGIAISARQQRLDLLKKFDEDHRTDLLEKIKSGDPKFVAELTDKMNCLSTAKSEMSQILLEHEAELAPEKPLSADDFINKMKSLLWHDHRFDLKCLPF